jgi:hypothetical protein
MVDFEDDDFEFVMQTPDGSLSKETRIKIRKQAMKAVAATRRRSGIAANLGPGGVPKNLVWQGSIELHPSPPMPFSGLELLVRDCGLDPFDLSALTSIHVGTM